MSTRFSGSRQIREGQTYRIRVEQADDVLELEVRERPETAERVLALIMLLLLSGWFIGFVPRIIKEPSIEHIGVVAVIAIWVACLNAVFPLSFERYRLGPFGLERAFRNCLKVHREHFPLDELRSITACSIVSDESGDPKEVDWQDAGEIDESSALQSRVRIDTRGRALDVGEGLAPEDCQWLSELLRRQLESLGVRVARAADDEPARPAEKDQQTAEDSPREELVFSGLLAHFPAVGLGLVAALLGFLWVGAMVGGHLLISLVVFGFLVAVLKILQDYRQDSLVTSVLEGQDEHLPAKDLTSQIRAVREMRQRKRSFMQRLRDKKELHGKKFEIVRARRIQALPEDSEPGRPMLAVTVEIEDGRGLVQLAGSVLAYYLVTALFWAFWFYFQDGQVDGANVFWAAFGFSILVLLGVIIVRALKFTVWVTAIVVAAIGAANLMMIDPPGAKPNSICAKLAWDHTEWVIMAWVLGLTALLVAESVLANRLDMLETVCLESASPQGSKD